MTTPVSSTGALGARLLREIAVEEGNLEDLFKDLRTEALPTTSRTGIRSLDDLWKQHGGKLSIAGRGLPLLYHIIDHIISTLNGTVALIDIEGRFSPSQLHCDMMHLHVFRPTKANLKATMDSVEDYMLWGDHESKGREWVGTILNGGVGGDVMVGWRGWLRVEKEAVGHFGDGVSVEEAWAERGMRQEVAEKSGWRAGSEIGDFRW